MIDFLLQSVIQQFDTSIGSLVSRPDCCDLCLEILLVRCFQKLPLTSFYPTFQTHTSQYYRFDFLHRGFFGHFQFLANPWTDTLFSLIPTSESLRYECSEKASVFDSSQLIFELSFSSSYSFVFFQQSLTEKFSNCGKLFDC